MPKFNETINRKMNVLQNEIVGYVKSQVLMLAIKYNIHRLVSNVPISIETLSHQLGFNSSATLRFLRLLEWYELVTITDDTMVIETPYTSELDSLSSVFYIKGYLAFEEFEHSLKSNKECWSSKFGDPFYTFVQSQPEIVSALANYLEKTGRDWLPSTLELSDFSQFKHIIDVGGGNGHFLSLILDRYPTHTGTILELSEMINEAKHYLSSLKNNTQNRISFFEGNFLKNIPLQADAFLFCRIFLNWSDHDSVKILKNASNAMDSESRIIIVDFVTPEKNHPHYERALLHDLNLLAVFGGSIRNKKQWRELLSSANIHIESFNITGCNISNEPNVPLGVIIGKKLNNSH